LIITDPAIGLAWMLLLVDTDTVLKERDMQTRPQGLLCLTAFAVLGTGCAITQRDNDDRTAQLPTGVTLLESDRNECEGSVALDERVVASARRADLVVQRGSNATFEIDADNDEDVEIEWTCVGASDTERNTAECPEDTSHVRIMRASTGDDFVLECYGDDDSRRARR
jgi:hypothetical protein